MGNVKRVLGGTRDFKIRLTANRVNEACSSPTIAPMQMRAARRRRQRPQAARNARSKPSKHAKSVDGAEHRYTLECAMDGDTFSIAHMSVSRGEMTQENFAGIPRDP